VNFDYKIIVLLVLSLSKLRNEFNPFSLYTKKKIKLRKCVKRRLVKTEVVC